MNTSTITLCNTSIRQDLEGRYCLNDLHKASGYQNKHRPSLWLKNQQAIDFIDEIAKAGNTALEQNQVVKVINGGNKQGIYVLKELVYAYGMWISATFSLKVIRAYDQLQTIPADYASLLKNCADLSEHVHQLLGSINQYKAHIGGYEYGGPALTHQATDSITINLAPLAPGKVRRWLVSQMANEAAMLHAIDPDQHLMTREEAIVDLVREGYIVIKKEDILARLT